MQCKLEFTERWRPVVGFEGRYSVSDLGRVSTHLRRNGLPSGHIMRQCMDTYGYPQLSLTDGLGWRGPKKVHALVVAAFIGPRPEGYHVNHKNGIRHDNRLVNLEYVTPMENVHHMMDVLGRRRDGEHNNAAKVTERQVVEIRERRAAGESYGSLSKAFGITSVMAKKIATGECWTDIGGPLSAVCRQLSKVTLSDEQVAEIVRRVASGERVWLLAEEYGVSRRTIYNYRDGKTRKK